MRDLDGRVISLDLPEQSDAKKRVHIIASTFLHRALDPQSRSTFFQAKSNAADLPTALTRILRRIRSAANGAHTARAARGERPAEVELAMRLASIALPGPNQARVFRTEKDGTPSKQCKVFAGLVPFVDPSMLTLRDIIGDSLSSQPLWAQFQMAEEVMVFWFGSYFKGFLNGAIADARQCDLYKGLPPEFVRWNWFDIALPMFYAVMSEEYKDPVTLEQRSLYDGGWVEAGVWKNIISDEVVSGIEGYQRARDFGSYIPPTDARHSRKTQAKRKERHRSPERTGRRNRDTESSVTSESDEDPVDRNTRTRRRSRSPQRPKDAERPRREARKGEPGRGAPAVCLDWAIAGSKLPRTDGRPWKECTRGTRCQFSHEGDPPRDREAFTALIETSHRSAEWKAGILRMLAK